MSILFDTSVGRLQVPYEGALQSKYIEHLLGNTNIGSNPTIVIPEKYSDVIGNYVYFTHGELKPIYDTDYMIKCFDMLTYFDDDGYFMYLVNELLNSWTSLSTILDDINSNLRFDIYLHCPYDVIPRKYLNNASFFYAWIDINKNTYVTLNGNEQHYKKYVTNDNDNNILILYHTTNGAEIGLRTEITFYDNKQLRAIAHYVNFKRQGFQRVWYKNPHVTSDDNKQLSYKLKAEQYCEYDLVQGFSRRWYDNPQHSLKQEFYYENGELRGMQKSWDEHGNLIENVML